MTGIKMKAAMVARFQGTTGRPALITALRDQRIVGGDEQLANKIAKIGTLRAVKAKEQLIVQGDAGNDIYLILAGDFDVIINGKKITRRFPGTHVGEMAAIEPTQRRAATITATSDAVVCTVAERHLTKLAREYPEIWRRLAQELARRLEQRNAHVANAHDKIRIFIISSTEAIEIARAVQNALDHDFTVFPWTDGVFRASHYPIENLERELDQSDFAVAIAQPDDVTKSRRKSAATPRDNVIFELGLFIGRLGRRRSFLLEPRGEKVKLPSDLSGITTISYKYDAKDLAAAMGAPCNEIRSIVRELGANN